MLCYREVLMKITGRFFVKGRGDRPVKGKRVDDFDENGDCIVQSDVADILTFNNSHFGVLFFCYYLCYDNNKERTMVILRLYK